MEAKVSTTLKYTMQRLSPRSYECRWRLSLLLHEEHSFLARSFSSAARARFSAAAAFTAAFAAAFARSVGSLSEGFEDEDFEDEEDEDERLRFFEA